MKNLNTLELVREFHNAFGVVDKTDPHIHNRGLNKLRTELIGEELGELCIALHAGDPAEVLDALTDLQYVLDGAFLQLGFAHLKDAAFREVHRSNMSKLGADGKPIRRADGKVMKGPNYSPPDLKKILAETH